MKDRKDPIQSEKYCPVCNKVLSGMRITDVGNHIKWCKFKNNPTDVYSQAKIKADNARLGQYRAYKVRCSKCERQFEIKERQTKFPSKQKYYCSRSCSNSRKKVEWSQDSKQLARQKSKLLWEDNTYTQKQLNRERFFTSKGERIIRDYMTQNHFEDQWTWGILNKRYNDTFFHLDIFSHKLKLVFQYDGISHFKTIYRNQDLQKSKLKQKVLQQWCMQNGYKLLRISESWFHSIGKDVSIVQNILYSLENPVTKLGAEYQE